MTSLQNLFVAKLPRNLTDSDLEQIFASYEPESAKIMLDATTGKSKGFGFVLFDSEEKGEKAYKSLNKTHVTLHGHSFNLAIFPSKHDGKVANEVSQCLYIRNLPKELSQAEVETFLRTFGNLTYCAMREDHYGHPVWVVYAEYETVEDAKNALSKLHGSRNHFENSPVAILAKYADSEEAKKERRKRREGQHGGGSANHSKGVYSESDNTPSPNPQGTFIMGNGDSQQQEPPPQQQQQQQQEKGLPCGERGYAHPHQSHKGYNNHFYKGAALHGTAAVRSAPDLYMPVGNDASSEGSNHMTPAPLSAYAADDGNTAESTLPQPPGGGFGASGRGTYTSAPTHRFAPPMRANASTQHTMVRNGSFDSATGVGFGPLGGPPGHCTVADVPMGARGYTDGTGGSGGNNLYSQNGGSAGGSTSNPTPLSQAFLGVTFPTTHPHYEQSSNERGTPVTPLSFNFEPDNDGQHMSGYAAAGGAAGPVNGSFPERTPTRAMSNLSSKSLTTGAPTAGTRYRHNPYAPVTPMSSAPSSAGPSTPRVVVSPHTAGTTGVSAFSNAPTQQQQQPQSPHQQQYGSPNSPHQPVSVTMHYGHSHTNSNSGITQGTHFASTDANGFLAVPDNRAQS